MQTLRICSRRSLHTSRIALADAPKPISHPRSAPEHIRRARDDQNITIDGIDYSSMISQAQAQFGNKPKARTPRLFQPSNIGIGNKLRARQENASGFEMDDLDAAPLSPEYIPTPRSPRLPRPSTPGKGKRTPSKRPARTTTSRPLRNEAVAAFSPKKPVNPKQLIDTKVDSEGRTESSSYTTVPSLRPGIALRTVVPSLKEEIKVPENARQAEVMVRNNPHLSNRARRVVLNEVVNLTGGAKQSSARARA